VSLRAYGLGILLHCTDNQALRSGKHNSMNAVYQVYILYLLDYRELYSFEMFSILSMFYQQ